VSKNMSIVFKPRNFVPIKLNEFTVLDVVHAYNVVTAVQTAYFLLTYTHALIGTGQQCRYVVIQSLDTNKGDLWTKVGSFKRFEVCYLTSAYIVAFVRN